MAQLVLIASSAFTPDQDEQEDPVNSLNRPVEPSTSEGKESAGFPSSEAVRVGTDGRESEDREQGAAMVRPELGMSTTVGEGPSKAAARRTIHAEDSELLEDVSFVQREMERPGKLQVPFVARTFKEGRLGY